MLSTPPAIISDVSPALIARAADWLQANGQIDGANLDQVAVGQDNEHPTIRAMLHPMLELLSHPVRRGGLWRGEKEEILGLTERGLYGRPQFGAGWKARLIAKNSHCAQSVPGLGKAVEPRL